MQSKSSRPLVGPGPRDPWKLVKWSVLAVGVTLAAVAGARWWIRHAPPTTIPPTFPAPTAGSTFQRMAALNNKYIAWADQQIHAQVPEIPATGPNAGTLTPAILNNAAVMKKWGGPKVPMSLAGITLPPGTPTNGSIVGLTPQFLQQETAAIRKDFPGITATQVHQAFVTAADFLMIDNGNNSSGLLRFLDPYADGGQLDQSFFPGNGGISLTTVFTAPAANGGMLPLRQVEYRSWVTTNRAGIGTSGLATRHPAGHVVIGNLALAHLTFYTIESGMVNGKLTVGVYRAPVGTITLALVKSGGQTRWYVTGLHGDQFGNTPQFIYWTAPQ